MSKYLYIFITNIIYLIKLIKLIQVHRASRAMGQGTRRPLRGRARPSPRPPHQHQGELPREGLRQHERAGFLRREAPLRGKVASQIFLLNSI